jgi:hypothetical protein
MVGRISYLLLLSLIFLQGQIKRCIGVAFNSNLRPCDDVMRHITNPTPLCACLPACLRVIPSVQLETDALFRMQTINTS